MQALMFDLPDETSLAIVDETILDNKCDLCGVKSGLVILRSPTPPFDYLIFVDNDYHTSPSGTPIRLSEIPSRFHDGKYEEVKLSVRQTFFGNKTVCQHCNN